VRDRGHPQQDQRDQHEDVDHPGHGPQDDHVDVPAVDVLAGRGARGADEVPDRTRRVVPPQPDPAELVHRAAVRGVEGEGAFLVRTGSVELPPRQRHLAGQEVHVGLVRREAAGLRRRGGGDGLLGRGQRRLRDAHVSLPVRGGQPPRLGRRAQCLRVVAEVHERVAGEPVRPFLGRLDRRGPVGRLDRLLIPVGTEVRAREQAPRTAAAGLGGDHAGEQRGRFLVPSEVEHGRGPRQLLPKLCQVASVPSANAGVRQRASD
jgi:hypothetical protein